MEGITVNNLWALLLAGASALVLLVNAVEKIVKIRKAAKAPNAHQDARLDALEAWRKEVDGKLLRDNERLAAIEEGDRVSQVALLALLDHGLDGNNVKQMQDAKERLQTHLINR